MTLKINTISDNKGARRAKKLLGRGIGSGLGKTCGRGGRGQTARSGVALHGFEGAQTPIYRRLPRRGLVNIHRIPLYELDFDKVNQILEKGLVEKDAQIDRELLIKHGYMPRHLKGVSLLANGTPKKGMKIAVTRATKKAQSELEKAGGFLIVE